MLEQPEEPQNEAPQKNGARRWVVPAGAAVLVAAAVTGIIVAQAQDNPPAAGGGEPAKHDQKPRYLLTAGSSGDTSRSAQSPWFQIYDITDNGRQRLVTSVQPPSATAGEVRSIVAAPDRTFVVEARRAKPCETVFHRLRLTDDGHVKDITPIPGASTPAQVAGLAISPDGRRIAFASAPCGDDPADTLPATLPITLTVLHTTTGEHRSWTSSRTTIVGEIVWAGDSRTVGYTTAEVILATPSTESPPTDTRSRTRPRDALVGAIQVRALHTEAPGADLLSGRVLFSAPADAGTVTSAVMNPDGRSGYGTLRKGEPPSTILFVFNEGEPMRVTSTIPPDPKGAATMVSVSGGDGPRYACLNGVDAFGRVREGRLSRSSRGSGACSAAYDTPY